MNNHSFEKEAEIFQQTWDQWNLFTQSYKNIINSTYRHPLKVMIIHHEVPPE